MSITDVIRMILDEAIDLFWDVVVELVRRYGDDQPLVRGRNARGDAVEDWM